MTERAAGTTRSWHDIRDEVVAAIRAPLAKSPELLLETEVDIREAVLRTYWTKWSSEPGKPVIEWLVREGLDSTVVSVVDAQTEEN